MFTTQQFAACADGEGKIYNVTFQGNQHVGWTSQKFDEISRLLDEALTKAEGYKRQLVGAGLLEPDMTPEERWAKLSKQVSELSDKVRTLTEVIEK